MSVEAQDYTDKNLKPPGAALDTSLSSLALGVQDDEEGDGDEGAEENSEVGGEGDLQREGHGGEGLSELRGDERRESVTYIGRGEGRSSNNGRSEGGGLGEVHLHAEGRGLHHRASSACII